MTISVYTLVCFSVALGINILLLEFALKDRKSKVDEHILVPPKKTETLNVVTKDLGRGTATVHADLQPTEKAKTEPDPIADKLKELELALKR